MFNLSATQFDNSNYKHEVLNYFIKPFKRSGIQGLLLTSIGLHTFSYLKHNFSPASCSKSFPKDLFKKSAHSISSGGLLALAVGIYAFSVATMQSLCFFAIKSIENKSLKNLENGIILELKCSHKSDVDGACDPNYQDVINCWNYSRRYAVVSHRIRDEQSFSEVIDIPKQYLPGQIHAIILTGHSSNTGMSLNSKLSRLSHENAKAISIWKTLLVKDGALILNGCYTNLGSDNIADEIRSIFPDNHIYATDKVLWRHTVSLDHSSVNPQFPFEIDFIDLEKKIASHR